MIIENNFQFSSVAQSCPTLCNPMNRNTPGLPVHHQLPESTQTHVHRGGDAVQPSHLLSSPSPPALNLFFFFFQFYCPTNRFYLIYFLPFFYFLPGFLETTDLFIITTVFPFPGVSRCIFGFIQYVSFSHCLLSLSKNCFRFLHIFCCFIAHTFYHWIISIVWYTISCFQVLTIMNKITVKFYVQVLCECKFSAHLGRYQREQLLDHTIKLLFSIVRNCQIIFQSGCTVFAFPSAINMKSGASTSSLVFSMFWVLAILIVI